MSRIVVKNLPKKVSHKKLHDLFSSKGYVTDLQLKYTKDGKFRQFAFVGYKTEDEAKAAQEYFHNTYVDSSKIQVEICANLGDPNKPKAWSKHTKEKLLKQEAELSKNADSDKKQGKNKDKSEKKEHDEDFPEELKNDAQFAEFLDVNKARISKPLWTDAPLDLESDENSSQKSSESENEEEESLAKKTSVSDLEYLKSKLEKNESDKNETASQFVTKFDKPTSSKGIENSFNDEFTVKLRNLPFSCKKKHIKQFFHPLKLESLRFPPKSKGFAYVKFKTEKDMKQALSKSKCVLDGHKIDVIKYEKKIPESTNENKPQLETKEQYEEELAETGRIFVRNLFTNVTETELQELFKKYGPISEMHLPIDPYTKKGRGIAFVSFLFPEHAVKAFTELDGTIFQGRMLHLIPSKPKIEVTKDTDELSFKKKKEAKLKALSGSSHNWNTLFLGLNAVADVLSKQYDVDKSKLLTDESKESVAVRMALGETQLVVETRKFLLKNGVQLDAFSQAAAERSKNVILVKNLPANTSSKELLEVFSKHGIISRIILPPSGITALVEFQEPNEAKLAFKQLAYSRFHHVPLYLEWAPINVLKPAESTIDNEEISATDEAENSKEIVETKEDDAENDEIEPEPGSVLFVKNLNFSTTEENLEKHFKKCGEILSVSISKKKNMQSGKLLSMGFGFIHFKTKSAATRALQDYQNSKLDGHKLELKFSNKVTLPQPESFRKKAVVGKQTSSKILVRNIPFEVTVKEVRDLFKEFGSLKSVRLPKKTMSDGGHRGFGFVDFATKSDAKRAFDALCHSTHLLGRRLVLEWANPDAEEVSELRKKTARDFYAEGPKAKLKKSKLLQDVTMAKPSKIGTDNDEDDDEEE